MAKRHKNTSEAESVETGVSPTTVAERAEKARGTANKQIAQILRVLSRLPRAVSRAHAGGSGPVSQERAMAGFDALATAVENARTECANRMAGKRASAPPPVTL